MSEGRRALEGGPAGRLVPTWPLMAHCRAHQREGFLEGPSHGAHPLAHVALGHCELVPQVIHGESLEAAQQGRKV